MTTLVSIRTTIHDEQLLTDDDRRTQWRRRAGTLPPHGTGGVVLRAVDGPTEPDGLTEPDAWSGLFLGSQWPAPAPERIMSARSHRRLCDDGYLRATA